MTDGLAQRIQADRFSFPGMLPREIQVWKAWLVLHEKEYDSFDYNVRLGQGQDPGPSYDEPTRRQAILNSQKRVDVVALQRNAPTLIEVKDRAQASAIGQLVTYDALWRQSNPAGPEPKLLLVTNRLAPDLIPVLARANIGLNLVEADFSVLHKPRP